ncbi:hypothetical protein [Streptomyces milbemycinicus]|uniref:Alkaline shock response membrane anchor protein AmaP n=1 Tax=Streptomyces milbemycinicus TaxID=476552 RepID=A0ABW8M0P5_9ACTN
MHRPTARANRVALLAFGLVLTAGGAAALARGLDLRPGLLGASHAPLIDEQARRYAADHWWFWAAVAACAALLALLALWWLAAQAHTDAIHHINAEPDPRHGATHLSARAATEALEEDLTASPYVRRAKATLTGAATVPRLTLTVTLTADTDPGAANRHIHQALAQLRHALESDRLTATTRIHIAPARH